MEFMLWEQRAWISYPFGRSPAEFLDQFTPVGEWTHDDTGKLILFRLKNRTLIRDVQMDVAKRRLVIGKMVYFGYYYFSYNFV